MITDWFWRNTKNVELLSSFPAVVKPYLLAGEIFILIILDKENEENCDSGYGKERFGRRVKILKLINCLDSGARLWVQVNITIKNSISISPESRFFT